MNTNVIILSFIFIIFQLLIPNEVQQSNIITGKILNKKNEPVEFATVYNITQQTSCITDVKGKFRLKASIGDSLRIQHLTYKTLETKITDGSPKFILYEKEFNIHEVIVSAKEAYDLFNSSCRNTWRTFKTENLSRAYCRCVRKTNDWIAQTVDLDLDISQKKLNRSKRLENIDVNIIQERIDKASLTYHGDMGLTLSFFYPLIHQIYWVELPKNFIYYKYENEESIVLRLKNKNTYDQLVDIEVNINRNDTTLKSFAMVKKDIATFNILKTGTGGTYMMLNTSDDEFNIDKTYQFIEYDYTDGFGCLSEYMQGFVVSEINNKSNKIELSEYLKTYNTGKDGLIQRDRIGRISKNTIDPRDIKNNYETEFWKNLNWEIKPFDFEKLK